ncbi:hypothetical protein ACQ86G_19300 [Roseateles chitinivorans]|uniref:hypothetical protein n=1 Tax=Roseateles chitinivorans TaxID=2917965 RepID=UPI003D673E0A
MASLVMSVHIFDIEIFRDGGSIEFHVERNGVRRHVFLETPLRGEPRALLIDNVKTAPHSPALEELLRDVDEWHAGLPAEQRLAIDTLLQRSGPFISPGEAERHAIDLSRVVTVQRYLKGPFLQPAKPAPPITDELRAEAKRHANGWVYVIDPALTDGERVTPSAFIGAWRVDGDGNIVADGYQANSRYREGL